MVTNYSILDLGTLDGTSSQAWAINNNGQVVGDAQIASGDFRAFLFTDANNNQQVDIGEMQNLGIFGTASESRGRDINNSGQVVGFLPQSNGSTRAFIWDSANGIKELGNGSTSALSINDNGQTVGFFKVTPYFHAIRWENDQSLPLVTPIQNTSTTNGSVVGQIGATLGNYWETFLWENGITPNTGTQNASSWAISNNDNGDIVGYTDIWGGIKAFKWNSGTMKNAVQLGSLSNASTTKAQDINDLGQVVGSSGSQAFLWTESGGMKDLGSLGNNSQAISINDKSQVVGKSNSLAFLWSDNNSNGQSDSGEMVDLNTLLPPNTGWNLTEARDINDAGQIVGTGTINGQNHAFLMTPKVEEDVQISINDVYGQEGGDLTFTVSLSKPINKEVTVNFSTEDDTAISQEQKKTKQDYQPITQGTLTFKPNEPITKEIKVTTINDTSFLNHYHFENFARDTAYHTNWKKNDDIDEGRTYDWGYRVDEVFGDPSDFYAVGLTSDEKFKVKLSNATNANIIDGEGEGNIQDIDKPPVLAIRGTEPKAILTLYDDTNPNGIGYRQFTQNKTSVETWLNKVSNPTEVGKKPVKPSITAHSLGGALAQWFTTNYKGSLGEVVTFNSPGITSTTDYSGNAEKITHYITAGDIVSMAGLSYLPGSYTLLSYFSGLLTPLPVGPNNKHSVPVIAPSIFDGQSQPNNLSKKSELSTDWLSNPFFGYHQDPDYFAFRFAVDKLVPYIGPYVAATLRFRGTTEANRVLIGSVLDKVLTLSYEADALINASLTAAKTWTKDVWDKINLFDLQTSNAMEANVSSSANNADLTSLNTQLQIRTVSTTLEQALKFTQEQLKKFTNILDFDTKMDLAFGNTRNIETSRTLVKKWADGNFTDLAPIKIVPSSDIYGANGSFSPGYNTIYLSQEYLTQNASNIQAISSVLLDEIGHSIDWQINELDSPGDEGEIFANFVQNLSLDDQKLKTLKAQNDLISVDLSQLENQPPPTEARNFWEAVSSWPVEAWNSTTQWSAEAWDAMTKWSPDNWNDTTKWTAQDWNKTTQWTVKEWNATINTSDTLSGNNLISGSVGDDTLIGGAGDDTYIVNTVGDKVIESLNEGSDLIQSSVTYNLPINVENITLTDTVNINAKGNSLSNIITGNSGKNVLQGLAGNDLLSGLGADDTLIGGTGDDTYTVNSVGDKITELSGEGKDLIQSSVTYNLPANVETITLTGTANINAQGNPQANVIKGNKGKNVLQGLAGNDTLTGGLGSDKFTYNTKVAFTKVTLGVDTITDFIISQGDKIVLDKTTFSQISSIAGKGFSNSKEFASVTSNPATSGADIVYNSATGELFYNQNGTTTGYGTGGKFLVFLNKPTLSASDFIIQA